MQNLELVECQQCGFANPFSAAFCGSCGTALVESVGVEEPTQHKKPAELQLAGRRIKTAYVGGAIVGVATLIFTLVAIAYPYPVDEYGRDAWALLDVVLIFGLSFGVYRKSRVSAAILLVYYVFGNILIFGTSQFGSFSPLRIVGVALFGYHFFRGLQGTIKYHKLSG